MRIPSSFRHTARLLTVLSVLTLGSIFFFSARTAPENRIASAPLELPLRNDMSISDGIMTSEYSLITNGILVTG